MVKYQVTRVLFEGDNNFKIVYAKGADGKKLTLKGSIPFRVRKDNFIEIKEMNRGTDNYGDYINVETASLVIDDSSIKTINALLMRTEGVGKVTANKITEQYGDKTIEILTDEEIHEEISGKTGVSPNIIRKIYKDIVGAEDFTRYIKSMTGLGLTTNVIYKIYEAVGSSSTAHYMVTNNPYDLIEKADIGFIEIDDLGIDLGFSNNHKDRLQAIIRQYISEETAFGDVYVNKSDIYENLTNYLYNITGREKDREIGDIDIEKGINELERREGIVIEDGSVYLRGLYFMEKEIAFMLADRIEEDIERYKDINIGLEIKELMLKTADRLFSKQIEAIETALSSNISIITGGPGTGKTFTIDFLIEVIKRIDVDATIELAAPTGKAANRMKEVTGLDAKTIHRLIGLGFEGFHELKRVEADYLIIDEISMVDTTLLYHLLNSTDLNTNIIFVGDENQLLSVGPGAVLKDLIESNQIDVTVLDEVTRQTEGSLIIKNLNNILVGDDTLHTSNRSDGEFYFLEGNGENEIPLLIRSIENMKENHGYRLEDIQVLSPIRGTDLGVENLNKVIQRRFNKNKGPKFRVNGYEFRVGDKVIHTVNNYDIEVFNGDNGVIKEIKGRGKDIEVDIEYHDRVVTYSSEEIGELELGYCLTVHKAQGSEYPIILMPLSKELNVLLNKSSIYTSISRASEKVVLIGDRDEYNNGVTKEVEERNTKLSSRISKLLGVEDPKEKPAVMFS